MSGRHVRGVTRRDRLITLLLVTAVFFGLCGLYPASLGGDQVASAAPTPAAGGPSGGGPAPIIIVFDLSSSMTEDDGTGTVKLAGAKRSLKTLVDRQPPNTEMGLWTYPTASDSCSAGGYVYGSGLQRVADPSTLAATIDGLQANGDTPTGDALRSAADAVRTQGRTAATFVLVSDGESNCGTDPCDVAKSISAEGFDITVQAMGFQISDEGRDELECIADATQGSYYDVSDSEQLSAKLSELSVPAIDVTVTAATTAPSGGMTTISAVVTNTSAQSIQDVMVGLQFKSGNDRRGILPAVIPPRYRLGSMAPGKSDTRSWQVSTTQRGVSGTMNWSVGAWGATTLPIRKRGTIVVTDGLDVAAGGTLLKSITTSEHPAIVMGDSFSSGEGTRNYLGADDDHGQLCHRSDTQYVSQLMREAQNKKVINLACSGAIALDLITRQSSGEHYLTSKGQLQMLDQAKAPSAVFMTMGGNDIGFGDLARGCILPFPFSNVNGCEEDKAVREGIATGMTVLDGLDRYYINIFRVANRTGKRKARDGAVAPLIVSAYPEVTPDSSRGGCAEVLLDSSEVEYINQTVRSLNTKIESEVNEAWDSGSEVYFVDSTTQAFMPDHTICDAVPYVNKPNLEEVGDIASVGAAEANARRWLGDMVTSGRINELVHPNVDGHGALAASIASWSTKPELERRPHYDSIAPPDWKLPDSYTKPDQRIDLTRAEVRPVVERVGGTMTTFVPRNTLSPFTLVRWFFQSQPQLLATGRANDDGSVATNVTIPPGTPAGIHHLTVTGTGSDGQPWTSVVEVRVKQPMPWWYWGFAAVTGLSALGALVAVWQVRRL